MKEWLAKINAWSFNYFSFQGSNDFEKNINVFLIEIHKVLARCQKW